GSRPDFLGELVDFRDHVRNLAQRTVQFAAQVEALVYDPGGAVHIFDRLARFFLNALDQFGNFLGRLRRLFRQLANLVGHHGEAETMFSGAGRFDGGVERQQVGLFREVVDDLDDLSNVVGALTQGSDDFSRTGDGCVDAVQAVSGLF